MKRLLTTLLLALLFSASFAFAQTVMEDAMTTSATEFGEAPMLADMVAAGDLPAVAERLPVASDIAVVEGVEGIGKYGGTWHNLSGSGDISNIKMILYDGPIRWKPDYSGYETGLAKNITISEDGTEVTWTFREGTKWSDGEPFTMEDMRFWWEDMATNADFRVVQVPWWGFNTTGEPMSVTFPDDYTMVMKWDSPRYTTPTILAQGFWEWEPLMTPAHYLKQFHPTYTDSASYEDLEAMRKWWENPDFPTVFAWSVSEYIPAERTTLSRNPYYWKVDTEGNQLPYIDELVIDIIPDKEVRVLELSQGKYEASFRGTDDPNDIPFLTEQAETGGYRMHQGAVHGAGGWPLWLINQDFADTSFENWEEIREVLRNKDVRRAFSHAMDRQRIVDVVWEGFGIAKQATISPQSRHFQSEEGQAVFEEWANSYASFEPETAVSLLDGAGVVDANGDGCRDLPSGADFQLVLDLTDWGGEAINTPATEVFEGNLNDVGICTIVNNVVGQPDSDLRQKEGLYMLRSGGAAELDLWPYPDWVFPMRDNRAFPMQGLYRQTGGAEGEEPYGAALALQEIYDRGLAESDADARDALVWEAVQIHIEEGPFMIAASGDQPKPVVLSDAFRGVPELVILGPWAPGSPGNLHPEQFWLDN